MSSTEETRDNALDLQGANDKDAPHRNEAIFRRALKQAIDRLNRIEIAIVPHPPLQPRNGRIFALTAKVIAPPVEAAYFSTANSHSVRLHPDSDVAFYSLEAPGC